MIQIHRGGHKAGILCRDDIVDSSTDAKAARVCVIPSQAVVPFSHFSCIYYHTP